MQALPIEERELVSSFQKLFRERSLTGTRSAKFIVHLLKTRIRGSQTEDRIERCCQLLIRILAFQTFAAKDLHFLLSDYNDVMENSLNLLKTELMIKKVWATDIKESGYGDVKYILIYQLNKDHPKVRQLLRLK